MRVIYSFLALVFLTSALHAQDGLALGNFQLLNTDGFVEQNGVRVPLKRDATTASVVLSLTGTENLKLEINNTEIILYKLPNGLATLTWDSHNSSLLHGIDLQAMSDGISAEDIPAWGANVAWPDRGTVQIVILPLGKNANTGFLVSHPEGKTMVRQMEFRKVFGPSQRPTALSRSSSQRPALN